MSIKNPTLSAAADLAHFRHFRHFYPLFPSTTVENSLQIHSFMQNKADFMRFSPENDDLTKNKPNLSQNKANSNPIWQKGKIDAKYLYTKDYEDICEYGQ